MKMKAEIQIECRHPEKIINAIEPDIDKTEKFKVQLESVSGNLKLLVESKDITGMLAAINSYLKMIRTLDELEEIK